jgi:F-type H+-transporting ATPase subunit b
MLIDWFTVGAQVANFVILVWLLKRFFYKPVLNAIDAREKRISAELANADGKKAEAQKERDDFHAKNKAFDDQRAALIRDAETEAKAERERLLGEARRAADELRVRQEIAMRSDWTRVGGEITQLITHEVFEIARRALADLANVSLEERIGEVFTRRLREMDTKAKDGLAIALRTSSTPALILSTFDIGLAQRAAIQNALNECFSTEVHVRFESGPGRICGIELAANGQKIAWNLADYLSSLERKVGALLEAQPRPGFISQLDTAAQPALRSVA